MSAARNGSKVISTRFQEDVAEKSTTAVSVEPPPLLYRQGYAVLRGVVPIEVCQFVARVYGMMVANNYLALNDGQVERGYAAYGLPVTETLLDMLADPVAAAAGSAVFPTYSYSRAYLKGATLAPHTDRPACEISCSVTLDCKGADFWPFRLQDFSGNKQEVALYQGDALLYLGPQVSHWRDRFDGDWQVQAFLHYVRQDGPNTHLRFDRRPRLGAPQAQGRRRVVTGPARMPSGPR